MPSGAPRSVKPQRSQRHEQRINTTKLTNMSVKHTWSHHYRSRDGRGQADVADLAWSCTGALGKVNPSVHDVKIQCHRSTRHIDDREGQRMVIRIESQTPDSALRSIDKVIVPWHHTAFSICSKIPKSTAAFFILTACIRTWESKAEVGTASIGFQAGVVVKRLCTTGLGSLVKDGNVPQHIDIVSNDSWLLCVSWHFACLEHLLQVSVHPQDVILKHCNPIRSWVAAAIPDYFCLSSLGADSSNHIQRVIDPVNITSLKVQSEASRRDDPWRY